jgi:hypothetical protein
MNYPLIKVNVSAELSEVCDKRPINNTATWQGLYDFSLKTEQETRTQIFYTDVV